MVWANEKDAPRQKDGVLVVLEPAEIPWCGQPYLTKCVLDIRTFDLNSKGPFHLA
jgi:hypothetical protein